MLFKATPYTHRYPHCWRCRTELLFRLVDEWYISVDELRPMLMDITRQIRWIPDFGLERELDWLRNMHDWMISKKRYWGLALPIWVCEACNRFEVVGSEDELRERAVAGWDTFAGHSPHRPWVDAVKIACSDCGAAMSRIPDVGNPWLDAGIVPFSTLGYRDGQRRVAAPGSRPTSSPRAFPASTATGSTRMLVMSAVLENVPPYKTVLGYGTLRGEDGQPMHKSLGNSIDFNEAAERSGADVMRWIFVQQNPAAAGLNFGWHGAEEAKRRLLPLWNCYSFFVTYAELEQWRPGSGRSAASRTHAHGSLAAGPPAARSIRLVRDALDDYDAQTASRAIEAFFEELSNWYVRRSRPRFWAPGGSADPDALATLHEALVTVTRLLAPVPAVSGRGALPEPGAVGGRRRRPTSVHHCEYPAPIAELEDEAIVEQMDRVRLLASLGHAVRKQVAIPVRRPLPAVRVAGDPSLARLPQPLLDELASELNVKRVEFPAEPDARPSSQRVETNPRLLGPKYGKAYPRLRAALQSRAFERTEDGKLRVELDGQPVVLEPEEASVSLEPAPGYAAAVGDGVLVVLDTEQRPR